MANRNGIDCLPNELFAQVLMPFTTRTLLPLAAVSHRFHDLILRIVHHRLLAVPSLQDHKLILECFHPSAKLTTPSLTCDYVGTDGLGDGFYGEADLCKGADRSGKLGKLSSIYSHFRPVGPDEERRPRRQPHPAGDVPGYPNISNTFPIVPQWDKTETPSQIISLESHELFSQLCMIVNLVKAVPNVGFLLSCTTIGEGVIRIWRNWLAERVLPLSKDKSLWASSTPAASKLDSLASPERILWLDNKCNIGIRLQVIEREDLGSPILTRLDEDCHVVYSIEYEELIIRTTQLLLKVEDSLLQETDETIIIFGSLTLDSGGSGPVTDARVQSSRNDGLFA